MHPRQEAAEKGQNKYEGKPCKHCGLTTRFTINAGCVNCVTTHAKGLTSQRRAVIKRLMTSAKARSL